MSYQIQRAVMIGLHVVVIVGAGACLPSPPGVACGDKWCPNGELCVPNGLGVGMQPLVCADQGACGNGIIEGDEACYCGDDGIIAPGAACAGQGNSATTGLCRKDCQLHCGDGVLDADEACDTQLEVTPSCLDLRYDFGQPSCATSCHEITAGTCELWNWQPMNPSPNATQILYSAWGSEANNVFVVGGDGILHYNGSTWHTMDSSITERLSSIWGSSPNDIFAVGGNGAIIHYDGSAWHAMDSTIIENLSGIWGSSPNDIFAVGGLGNLFPDGERSKIIHYNGTIWQTMLSIDNSSNILLEKVWGSGPNDVFVVGDHPVLASGALTDEGIIYHYNGNNWTPMLSLAGTPLYDVWGSGPEDIFVVGARGVLLHYNGIEWTSMDSGSPNNLYGVTGRGPNDVFAVGGQGTVLHYDGNRWQAMTSGSDLDLFGTWANATNDVLAVGDFGTMLHYAGSSWQQIDTGGSQVVTGIWGSRSDHIFAVGDAFTRDPLRDAGFQPSEILHYNGSEWMTLMQGIQPPLWDIWGCDSQQVFAIGGIHDDSDNGTILRFAGGSWVQMAGSENRPWLTGIWGNSCSDAFAVGWNGTILHYDGNRWTQMDSGTGTYTWLSRVWGSNSNDVYAVGGFNSGSNDGLILHYNGNNWQQIPQDPELPLLTDVWGSSPHDIFVVGADGTVLHYDGTAWTRMKSSTSARLWRVWGTGSDDVYAVGELGTILHYDGQSWRPMRSDTTASFYSIWGDRSSNTLLIGGSKTPSSREGVIYQMTRPRPHSPDGPPPPDMGPAQTMVIHGIATTFSVSDSGVTEAPTDLSHVPFSSFSSASGSLEWHGGTGTANGRFTVPVDRGATDWQLGYQFHTNTPEFVVSNATAPDFSAFQWGRADQAFPTSKTDVTLTLTGLTAWQPTDSLQMMSSNVGAVAFNLESSIPDPITAGATALANETFDWWATGVPLIDAAKGDKTQIYQLVTQMAGTEHYLALGNLATLTNFTTTDGVPSTLTADLTAVPRDKTFTLHFKRSQFEGMSTDVGPGAVSSFQLFAIDALPDAIHRGFFSAAPDLLLSVPSLAATDLDQTVAYANPFSTGGVPWDEFAIVEYDFRVPILAAGAQNPFFTRGGYFATLPLASITGGNVTPLVTPVRNVKVGGQDVSTPKPGVGLTPLVTWDAPTTGTPTSYTVRVSEVKLAAGNAGKTAVHSVAVFHTTATSLHLPPMILANGASYLLQITAEVAHEAHITTTPHLRGLSDASATSITAQFKP